MTLMDLKLCASLVRQADDMQERIARMRSMLEITASQMSADGVQASSPVHDRIAEQLANLSEREEEWAETSAAYLEHVAVVEAEIGRLESLEQQRVLQLRYIDGKTWGEISDRMFYNERHCRRLHNDGLRCLGIMSDNVRVG